jgi:predicted kinase
LRRLVLVTGYTAAGKSTIAEAIAHDLGCAVGSFDWLMSALRPFDEVWSAIELPVERQRAVGWSLLTRLAEQQLRNGRDLVLDLVAREQPRAEWAALADRYDSQFSVIECVCSDVAMHRSRVDGRSRAIPGWYELTWRSVEQSRENYEPLAEPKLVIDAINALDENLAKVRAFLGR